MAEFVFTSPGVKFRERDITFVTRNVGITTLGVVGETLKGPAFEPIFIQDQTQFMNRFGAQSTQRFPDNGLLQYQLPYVANSYLNESNQMYVTRVLGLSGYEAGIEWAITLSAGVDPSTKGVSGTTTGKTVKYTGNTYLGVALYATGQTGTQFTGYTKISGTTKFVGIEYAFTATTITTTGGTVHQVAKYLTGTSYTQYENMVLAVIRSRGYVVDQVNAAPKTVFSTSTLSITGNSTNIGTGDMFAQFTLNAYGTGGTPTTQAYTVSMNPDASSFISNVLGNLAKDKKTKIWVQATYPDLIKKIDAEGWGYGINTALIECNTDLFTDYNTTPVSSFGFKTPETPWVVSQLKGSKISRLFKFVSISDGDAANQEIKISIANINPITLEFDVLVRAFYDTDAQPNVLETYSKCNLIVGSNNYIAQAIGSTDGEYDLVSQYIMVEMDSEEHEDSFPAGFEGYWFNDYASGSTGNAITGIPPAIFYKTSYNANERIARVYLGVSPSGYDAPGVVGAGINQNFFNFDGYRNDVADPSGYTKTLGFHMDSGATGTYYDGTQYIGQFETGAGSFEDINDVVDPLNPYYTLASRLKFTWSQRRST